MILSEANTVSVDVCCICLPIFYYLFTIVKVILFQNNITLVVYTDDVRRINYTDMLLIKTTII